MLFVVDLLKITNAEAIAVEQFSREPFLGITTDSRTISSGNIFLALRGEKFDGHNFVQHVFQKGIPIAIVERNWYWEVGSQFSEFRNFGFILVDDCAKAYGFLAAIWRMKFDIPVLAISGSNGKTTTKEMLSLMLQTQYNVHSTKANNNNHIGVPQTLFGLQKHHEIAVLEFGSNHLGEIEYLSNVAHPTHAIVTNIGREHLEYFGSLESVATEETKIFENAQMGFVNVDDYEISKKVQLLAKKKTYGFHSNADITGNIVNIDGNGCVSITISNQLTAISNISLSVPGKHNALNALASATVGFHFGISNENIKSSLETFHAYEKRMECVNMNGMTIINDTYNSNPDSVIAALETLQKMKTRGRKIIVLGDMLELGNRSEIEHKEIGKVISTLGFEYLLVFGKYSKSTVQNARIKFSTHYEEKQNLISDLLNIISVNDIVLVKGSRGMKMEEIVDALIVN